MNMSELIINPWTINIFSDASTSIKYRGAPTDVCYGAIAFCGYQKLDEWYRVLHDSTSNHGEIKGINLAVRLAIDLINRGYIAHKINIFSDSQLSVFGIRDRCFRWKEADNHVYSPNGENQLIASQEVFIETMQLIVEYGLPVFIWDQKAHIAMSNPASLKQAKKAFQNFNRPPATVDDDFIYYISQNNNEVDKTSRRILKQTEVYNKNYYEPLYFIPNEYIDLLHKYKHNINMTKKG